MTVCYVEELANVSFLGFGKLLFRWKGSILKLLWKDFVIYSLLFTTVALVYNFALPPAGQMLVRNICKIRGNGCVLLLSRIVEKISKYCELYLQWLNAGWLLGLYVSLVVKRFYEQLSNLPFITRMALFITAYVHGDTEQARMIRRTLIRYVLLANLFLFRAIAPTVTRRFPTVGHITKAGLMTPEEQETLESIQTMDNQCFIPFVWAVSVVKKAQGDGYIKSDRASTVLITEINSLRSKCMFLFRYNWVPIPLIYTQVVTWSVYTFLVACLFARQNLNSEHSSPLYVPVFTVIQYFLYMGWLKVGEAMMNPFGNDDDDYDLNGLLDASFSIGYKLVDEILNNMPEITKDAYWKEIDATADLPYTKESEKTKKDSIFLGTFAVSPKISRQLVSSHVPIAVNGPSLSEKISTSAASPNVTFARSGLLLQTPQNGAFRVATAQTAAPAVLTTISSEELLQEKIREQLMSIRNN